MNHSEHAKASAASAGKLLVGARVAEVETGREGTVVGRVVAAGSAGGALMVRVRWDHGFVRADSSMVFVSRLRRI